MEWQPIETAPKDGSWLLALVPGFIPAVVQWNSNCGKWLKEAEQDWDHENDEEDHIFWSKLIECCYKPEFWLPLPTPPEVDSSSPK